MPKITVVGLGPWEKGFLTEQALKVLSGSFTVLRTEKHPAASELRSKGIRFSTMDHLYESSDDFNELNARVAMEITQLAQEHGTVTYAVPGQGVAGDSTVAELLTNYASRYEIDILPGVDETAAFLSACAAQYGIPMESYTYVAGPLLENIRPDRKIPLVVTQLDSKLAAGEAKLQLSNIYGDEALVLLSLRGKIQRTTVAEMDHHSGYDHRTMALLAPSPAAARYNLYDIVAIMDRLRGPGGCPWDREQTHETLKQYLLEESYEVFEAIDRQNMEELCEELGDVLLQVVFHARLAQERGDFDITDVSNAVSRKMILRHPHIFGNVVAETSEQVLLNWDAIKKKEKGQNTETGMMKQIPQALPALVRSMKVQSKAAKVGFDWENVWGAYDKLEEEVGELKEAISSGHGTEKLNEELGDVLFAAINVSRFIDVHPEFALKSTVEKFIRRFEFIEKQSGLDGKTMENMTLAEMDEYWNRAKFQG